MRILMLAHRLPYPPNKGDKIRAYQILRHLARRHEVSLASAVDDVADLRYVDTLRTMASEVAVARIDGLGRRLASLRALIGRACVTVTHFHQSSLQRQVDAWFDRAPFEVVLCFSAASAEYLFRSRHCHGPLLDTRKIMDLVDVDSLKWRQYAETANPVMARLYRREAQTLSAYERRIAESFDRVFLSSPAEAALLDAGDARGKVGSFVNGVDLDYFRPCEPCRSHMGEPWVVFTGMMDYLPNVDAVRWFADEVFPYVRQQMPAARFVIVGGRPASAVRRLASRHGITVTGFVEDVRGWIAQAAVCVAPLRIARGIQNKVLEAMAMGRPVIASPQALEGIRAQPGQDVMVAAQSRHFADAVLTMLRDPMLGAHIGRSGRRFVERHHRWDVNLAVLDEAIG
jgi:sugar transferase (PEP-CTERM/EpsH1 system associated)